MIDKDELKKRARELTREQFEFMDFVEYHWTEVADDVADMMVDFALHELERAK